MYEILFTTEVLKQADTLPLAMQPRVQSIFERLRQWPNVSGTKPLRHAFKGAYRVRTGDWRILFTVDAPAEQITVFRVENRRDVYDE